MHGNRQWKITVCWFVCMFAPSLPAKFTLWESTYQKVWCLISCDCWHNHVLQRAKQCLETNCERGLRAAIKWYETVFHTEPLMSRTKPVDFTNSTGRWGRYYTWTTDTIITHSISFLFWHLTAFDLGASGHRALLYFVCASANWDKLRKLNLGRHKPYRPLK